MTETTRKESTGVRELFGLLPIENSEALAIIPIESVELARHHKWYLQKNTSGKPKLICCYINRKHVPISNFVMNFQSSIGEILDHVDRNVFNNLRSNLRVADQSQNAANRVMSFGNSDFKGVSLSRRRWRAAIKIHGKKKSKSWYVRHGGGGRQSL